MEYPITRLRRLRHRKSDASDKKKKSQSLVFTEKGHSNRFGNAKKALVNPVAAPT